MDNRAAILKNTLALAVPNVLNPFISFLLILVISRYLGVQGLGAYSLVMAYLGIFGTLASLGLADLVVRETAREPDRTHLYFFNAAVFGSLASLVAFGVMNAMIYVMGYERDIVLASFVGSFSLVSSTAITYLEAIFRSVEKSKYIAFAFVFENLIKVAVCVYLLLEGYGVITLFAVVVATRFLSLALLSFFYIRVLGRPGMTFDTAILRVLLKEAPTFTSIAVFSTIHLSLDSIMLSKLQSVESVGIYSAADRLLTICKTIPIAFASALLPFFTRELNAGIRNMQSQVHDTLRYLSVLLVPMVVGTMILADQIILLIYGMKFATAGQVLRYHIISLIPFSMVFLLAQVLIASDNQRVDLVINILAAFVNFALNWILIPYYAEMGAVFATLISILIFNELQYLYIRKYLFHVSFLGQLARPMCAAAGMALVTMLLKDYNLFLNVGVSAVIYGALALAVRAVTMDDMMMLYRAIPGRAKNE